MHLGLIKFKLAPIKAPKQHLKSLWQVAVDKIELGGSFQVIFIQKALKCTEWWLWRVAPIWKGGELHEVRKGEVAWPNGKLWVLQ